MPSESLDERMRRVQAHSQETLVQFLLADLDLAFTALDSASTSSAHKFNALTIARRCLESVRAFEGRIHAREDWNRVHSAVDKLEHAIKELG